MGRRSVLATAHHAINAGVFRDPPQSTFILKQFPVLSTDSSGTVQWTLDLLGDQTISPVIRNDTHLLLWSLQAHDNNDSIDRDFQMRVTVMQQGMAKPLVGTVDVTMPKKEVVMAVCFDGIRIP